MQILLSVYIAAVTVQLLYWVLLFWRLTGTKHGSTGETAHSIVVCYKNEERNLSKYLSALAKQKASELLLVDDFSTDTSSDIAQELASVQRTTHLRPDIDRPGKKAALLRGVASSRERIVVLTDADTRAASKQWSQHMAGTMDDHLAVLGYAPMEHRQGWVPTFARYETYLTGVQYLSYAQMGLAYMGVGRNMAVDKQAALPHLQQMASSPIASGDDDMLIQALSKEGSIGTHICPEAFVYSEPPMSLSVFIDRKSRHITTSTAYAPLHQLLLGLFAASHIGSYLLFLLCIVLYPSQWHFFGSILLVKWTLQMVVNHKLMKILHEEDLWYKFPLLDIATFVYYMALTPYLFFKNRTTWSSY